ncbi:hypothetical protein LCGC14_0342510 [marine sediment metagenome]|uniref:Uncharacterized protein n=1 Tax=marine sediment metagenome TaxID=412755 RepID=A0A0F9TIZ7_9ZZZZ
MKQITHTSVNLKGLLRNMKGRKIDFMTDDDGKFLSDKEVRNEIDKLLAKGHKLMCNSTECNGFDPYSGGCPGHIID